MCDKTTRRGWAVLWARAVFTVEFDAAPQEVDGAGTAENVLVKALRVGAREDERNTPLVLRELPHPFEGVLAIGRIEKDPSFPRTAEAATHFRVMMHLGGGLPGH